MNTSGRVSLAVVLLLFLACSPSAMTPVEIDSNGDACHFCRMTISNPRLALQVLDPGEEPRFFDDIGCAAHELRGQTHPPPNRRVFVADVATGAWMPIESAVLERCAHIETPMASHLVARAKASGEGRCTAVKWREILR
jgi:copper chaperone NosL